MTELTSLPELHTSAGHAVVALLQQPGHAACQAQLVLQCMIASLLGNQYPPLQIAHGCCAPLLPFLKFELKQACAVTPAGEVAYKAKHPVTLHCNQADLVDCCNGCSFNVRLCRNMCESHALQKLVGLLNAIMGCPVLCRAQHTLSAMSNVFFEANLLSCLWQRSPRSRHVHVHNCCTIRHASCKPELCKVLA